MGRKKKNLVSLPSLTTLEKLYSRFVGSRSLSSFKLSRDVLARVYSGYVRVNVHWTTLWIRKAAQAHLSLGDCSTTARRSHRIAGVVVAPVMLANLLGIQSWICSPDRLVLRYSVMDPQLHVLRNPVRPRGGGFHCSVEDHAFVILFSGPSTGVGPTVQLRPMPS